MHECLGNSCFAYHFKALDFSLTMVYKTTAVEYTDVTYIISEMLRVNDNGTNESFNYSADKYTVGQNML